MLHGGCRSTIDLQMYATCLPNVVSAGNDSADMDVDNSKSSHMWILDQVCLFFSGLVVRLLITGYSTTLMFTFAHGRLGALVALVGLEGGGGCLALVALEQRPQRQHLGQDAAGGPHVRGRCIVARSQQQLWRAVPDCHHHAVI